MTRRGYSGKRQLRVHQGGAVALGSVAMRSAQPPRKQYCQHAHRWITAKWSRTCRDCGFEQAKDSLEQWEDISK